MKLFLMRHAEAEINHDKIDAQRCLTAHGKSQAINVGQFLKEKYQIDKMLVSSAKRTTETFECMQDIIKCKKYEFLSELYNPNTQTILNIIAKQPNEYKNLLVISHNPSIFKAGLKLLNVNSPAYDILLERAMPPANIIILDFEAMNNWSKLSSHDSVRLLWSVGMVKI